MGTTGSDFDLTLVRPGWGRDLRLDSTNVAGFVEQSFSLSDRWRLNVGARVESGRSDMTGLVVGYAPGELPNTIRHEFVLAPNIASPAGSCTPAIRRPIGR